MCKISVVVPIYNKARYLPKLIKSFLRQSFRDFELLLVDDGSTDQSKIICDEFSMIDVRVKVFHKENGGVSAARNFGIKKAAGKYICFADADDIVEADYLSKLYQSITSNNADLAVCDFYEVKNGKKQYHILGLENNIEDIYEVVRYNILGILWNKMFVKEKIKHYFVDGISTCEDSIFCVQYFLDNRPKIVYVNEILYGYLRHNDGLTASIHTNAFKGIHEYCSLYYSLVKEITDDEKKRVAMHSICKIYFFLICSFIFENLSSGAMEQKKLLYFRKIIRQIKYQKIIKNIVIIPWLDSRAEKTTLKEYIYIIFSLLKMEKMIYIVAKTKRRMKPFEKYK